MPARQPTQWMAIGDLDRDGDPEIHSSLFGSAPLVLRNRDLVVGPAVLGQPFQAAVGSQPGYAVQATIARLGIALTALPQPVVVPGIGELWLAAGGPLLLVDGMIAPALGEAVFGFVVPNAPAVAGVVLHLQGLVEPASSPPRLSAYVPVVVQ